MNKDEIKKGLEVCVMNVFRIACKKCPYNETNKCNDTLCKDALNLINEQEKEIERLQKTLADILLCVKDTNCGIDVERIRKQAVKDFAEKLKAKAVQEAEVEDYVCYIVNRLLKEYEK